MLAYVFWHRPREDGALDTYEQAQIEFHRSLAENPPAGFSGSACYRAADVPWLAGAATYEDWYFVDSYTALGVLNDAVGHGHRETHDEIAGRFGGGAGGLYGLIEGTARCDAASVSWVGRRPGLPRLALEQMLEDGVDQLQASLWRRQFVFGPAPEYCVLGSADTHGISAAHLPEGWRALSITRSQLTA